MPQVRWVCRAATRRSTSTSSTCGTSPRASTTRLTRTWATASGAAAPETTRGGAPARAFDLAKKPKGYWIEQDLRRAADPRAQVQRGRDLGQLHLLHPAGGPGGRGTRHPHRHPSGRPARAELGGVPRCIFSSFDGYHRALEIADSPNIGVCLCVGCWLEGGKLMGQDALEAIRYFGGLGKLFKVHFRNVDAPLPHFVETFIDNGYQDMYR